MLQINSAAEQERMVLNKISSLQSAKKLALVLDLDHTLVHAVRTEGAFSQPSTKRQTKNGML